MALYRCIGSNAESITPSNSSPVALTADVAVKPTSGGYAIASYNSVTPSNSSPVALTSGDIDKMGGAGYAIESYSSVTPSDSSPVSLTSGSIYKMGGSGKAVESITDVTPSNESPVALTSGDIDKINGNGYAISSYDSVQPSDTNAPLVRIGDIIRNGGYSGYLVRHSPTSVTPSNSSPVTLSNGNVYYMGGAGKAVASVTDATPGRRGSECPELYSGDIYKATSTGYFSTNRPEALNPSLSGTVVNQGLTKYFESRGYVYSTDMNTFKSGTFTASTSATKTVSLGFEPKYIATITFTSSNYLINIYNYDLGYAIYAGNTTYTTKYTLTNTTNNRINSISSTGFVFGKASSSNYTSVYYFALG